MANSETVYSAAFFLLGGSLEDAVDVCVKQLKDLQLAVAISRVYEGDNGPVLRKLLQEQVLDLAAREGDRWLASWAFWMLGRKDMAVRALIVSFCTYCDTSILTRLADASLQSPGDPRLPRLEVQVVLD